MRIFYLLKEEDIKGPFSLEELKSKGIYSDTLMCRDGWSSWQPASEIPEVKHLIKTRLPPIPTLISQARERDDFFEETTVPKNSIDPEKPPYDYSRVEDIAGVDYKQAMGLTVGYIALHLLARGFVVSELGVIASTALACFIWYFFKQYFDAVNDQATGRWINWVIGAYLIFGLINIYSLSISWEMGLLVAISESWSGNGTSSKGEELLGTIAVMQMSFYAVALTVFIVGIKLIQVNKKHPFPLKRIAVSAMILIPISMVLNLIESGVRASLIYKGGFATEANLPSVYVHAFLLLPYYFLFHHFYRADVDDATP